MTPEQQKKCAAIIHSHATVAAVGNIVPVPGLGIAVDVATMTTMTMSLVAVFGGNVQEHIAKTMALTALKNTLLRQPIKTIGKELSKLIPILGQLVAPAITVALLESAGWALAHELDVAAQKAK
jgi:uncharacterized protein (DUF697 family)